MVEKRSGCVGEKVWRFGKGALEIFGKFTLGVEEVVR
jgi:hypothetical protein